MTPLPPQSGGDHRSELTLPIPQAHFIWRCAWLSVPAAIYAATSPAAPAATTTHLALVPASVFATSLLYWRNPVRNSWRRTLDMAVVFSGVTYQTYYAFRHIHGMSSSAIGIYTALIGCSAACYGLSQYLLRRGHIWPATYAHASIHLVANVANFVLYDAITKTAE
jgi:hypothetical protein